jgi:hypothetical protein
LSEAAERGMETPPPHVAGAWVPKRLGIRGVAVLVSLVLSAWCVYRDPVINHDGILYIRAAEAILSGGWRGGMAIYPWPFYAWLLALIHQGTGLGLEPAAHVLDAVLQALAVWAFITVVRELGGDRRAMLAAALVILVHPPFNDYRSFVIRDFGYWAFYLVALFWFLRFFKAPGLGAAVAWGASMVLATLFRIEGLVILLLAPLALLFRPDRSFAARCRELALAHGVVLAALVALAVWWVAGAPVEQTGRLAEPMQWLRQIGGQLTGGFREKATALAQSILNQYSARYAMASVFAVLGVIFLGKTIGTLTPLYTLLALHSWRGRLVPVPAGMGRVLAWFVAVQTVILVGFLVVQFFLTGRHAVAWALTAMLVVAFSLVELYDRWQRRAGGGRTARWLFPAVCAILVVMAIEGLFSFGPSKLYLREAGLWLKERTAPEAKIHGNNRIVAFYAGKRSENWARGFTWDETAALLKDRSWSGYDYVAVALDRRHPEHAAAVSGVLGDSPVARFENGRGDQVLVFATR